MITPTLLHRLEASQTASDSTVSLDSAIESAITDLRRIERGIIWGRNEPGEFTMRKIEAVVSRLLGTVEARRLAMALVSRDALPGDFPAWSAELPSDCERSE